MRNAASTNRGGKTSTHIRTTADVRLPNALKRADLSHVWNTVVFDRDVPDTFNTAKKFFDAVVHCIRDNAVMIILIKSIIW